MFCNVRRASWFLFSPTNSLFFSTLLCRSRSKLLQWYRKTIDQSDLRMNTVVDVNTIGLWVTA